jgi:hypothetical protein
LSDKPSVYLEDGKAIYRASALGNCQNALLLARLGYTGSMPPQWMQDRYDEGNEQEAIIGRKLERDFGFHLYGEQQTMEIDCGSKAMVRGHCDWLNQGPFQVNNLGSMVAVDVEGPVVVDAKAFAVSTYAKWRKTQFKGFDYYLWQMSVYAHAIGAVGVVMAVKNKNTSQYLVEYFPTETLRPMADVICRVLEIEDMATNGVMPFDQPCSPKMFPCPYFMMHPSAEKRDAPEQLQSLVDERQKLKQDIAVAEGRVASINGQIIKLCPEPGTYNTEGFTTTLYRNSSSVTDWEKLALDANTSIEIIKKEYTIKKPSDKLTVSVTAIPQKEIS